MSLWASKKDKYLLYNNLGCLLKAVEGKYTTIDLRNEAFICGKIEQVDGMMNVFMTNTLFSDPSGKCSNYEKFFVQARNIRYVHIPREIQIIPALKAEISKVLPQKKSDKRTFKQKRSLLQQQETLKLVSDFHKKREFERKDQG